LRIDKNLFKRPHRETSVFVARVNVINLLHLGPSRVNDLLINKFYAIKFNPQDRKCMPIVKVGHNIEVKFLHPMRKFDNPIIFTPIAFKKDAFQHGN